MSQVSVILLNWNGLHYLKDCLPTLLAQTYTDFDVILADNGSTDGSVEWVKTNYPQVRLLRNETNVGFCVANNRAIHATTSPYIVLLNNDTRVEPGWLAALVQAAESDPSVGMCASKMLFADHPDMINSTGISLDPVGIAWDRGGGERDDPQEREPVEIFGPCGGAALYRRAMLDQIGLFDEDLVAYLEDLDLAWRARLAGWRCLYVPSARVYHVHSGTWVKNSPWKSRLLGRNKVWTIAKNYSADRLWIYLPLIVAYDLAAVLFALITLRDVNPLRGRLEGLKGLPGILRKRQEAQALIKSNRGQPWHRYLSSFAPPWQVRARYQHLGRAR
jgi:GT2 family glycosyltransferase